ncbi:hypothetical protein M9H77_23687 [Catharanthus roseus]|uniref:Uncharacterized protein n=1 Tax=Catharanthus roseus TaxID=4058 RepID=A0ACC0AW58_CATRO|nr:hypothetical protein M9H77_23687 [Catharanthus roseus]
MPYHLPILHRPVLDGEKGKGEARLEERAVQGCGDIASKQQSSPFRTDYNKLATLIETNGKLSALFLFAMLYLSKLAKASLAALYSLRCSTELGLRFIRPNAFSELLEAIERVPNADGDFSYRADASGVTGNLMVPGRRCFLCKVGILITN